MRHAKSSWKSDAPTDHARPLNKRGRKDAPKVANKLAELGWVPDLVLSSDSERTQQTYKLMKAECDELPPANFSRSLYHAGFDDVCDVLKAAPDDKQTVLLLGHNPGWEDVLEHLTGVDDVLKTANAALLTGAGETWKVAISKPWKLGEIIRSRAL